ncbi:protein of unknown function [Modestobacter italicus]|uniref:Uncharacterized protein n=1 Tax=Modestobacter italicus (strain DSM 44449 / CECT 9708 / BC 501) TaxID=2732864 RepID=I4EYH1_MODI5|nr:protein of unknown function [Modestobacter marinus]
MTSAADYSPRDDLGAAVPAAMVLSAETVRLHLTPRPRGARRPIAYRVRECTPRQLAER